MRDLLIVGAGGFGREVLNWALAIPETQRDWQVAGFLDSNPKALDGFSLPYRVIGDPLNYVPTGDEAFLCAIGEPEVKLRVCRGLKARGAKFVSLIHPTVVMGSGCVVSEGCVLCPGVILTTNVKLGEFVILNLYTIIGHDAVVGDGSTLNPHSAVTGWVKLGEGVLLGTHATILPRGVVGDYAVVGSGSVVLRKVRAHTSVMGVPAQQIAGFEY